MLQYSTGIKYCIRVLVANFCTGSLAFLRRLRSSPLYLSFSSPTYTLHALCLCSSPLLPVLPDSPLFFCLVAPPGSWLQSCVNMSFADAVHKLRDFFGIDVGVPLSDAVDQMLSMMDLQKEQASLKEKVDALVRATGVMMQRGGPAPTISMRMANAHQQEHYCSANRGGNKSMEHGLGHQDDDVPDNYDGHAQQGWPPAITSPAGAGAAATSSRSSVNIISDDERDADGERGKSPTISTSASGSPPKKSKANPSLMPQRTLGAFFGPVLIQQHVRGSVVSARLEHMRDKISVGTLNAQLQCKRCGRHFSHPPALSTHVRFCKQREAPQTPASHENIGNEPDETARRESAQDETPATAGNGAYDIPVNPAPHPAPDAEASNRKRRKSDGKVKQSGLREGQHRTPYSLLFKYQVAMDYSKYASMKERGLISNALARTSEDYNGLSVNNIWNWHKLEKQLHDRLLHEHANKVYNPSKAGGIASLASREARRLSLHAGSHLKYHLAETKLLQQFKDARNKGERVSVRWLSVNMKKHVAELYGDEAARLFKASHGWLLRFTSRNSLSPRRATNGKHESVEDRLHKIKRWHVRFRWRLASGPTSKLHPKWGRWLPQNRLSVDQVPCNLREGNRSTYAESGSKRVWMVGTKADDGKRFCTLQIIARASNGSSDKPRRGQPKIGIIFRGKGARISDDERAAWHKDVHVRFQPKAWADAAYCEAHAAFEMREATEEARSRGEQSVVLYDNLHGQTTAEHLKILQTRANCSRHLLPTGVTSEIQLIDDGIGYAVKNEMGHALDNWLTQGENMQLWVAKEGGFPMWKKRALITHLAAEAWERVCGRFDFEKAATRIGMRMTIDGSGDEYIKLQGVENYSFCEADGGDRPSRSDEGELDAGEIDWLDSCMPDATDADDGDETDQHTNDEDFAEEPIDSSDSDEDDTAEGILSRVPPAPQEAPEGYVYALEPPSVETDEDCLALVGQHVLHAWDTPNIFGWFIGRVSARGVSARDLLKTSTANFVVTYDKRVTKNRHLHGRVASSLLPEKYGRNEWWLMLKPKTMEQR